MLARREHIRSIQTLAGEDRMFHTFRIRVQQTTSFILDISATYNAGQPFHFFHFDTFFPDNPRPPKLFKSVPMFRYILPSSGSVIIR